MQLADVALPVPLGRALTYAIPEALAARVVAGSRVLVPLGPRRALGVVLAVRDGEPPPRVRAILGAPDEEPAVPVDLLEFLRELSSYYLAPLGEVLRLALPPMERRACDIRRTSGILQNVVPKRTREAQMRLQVLQDCVIGYR